MDDAAADGAAAAHAAARRARDRRDGGAGALALLKHASMRCGGCGAKVGADVLSRAMGRLKPEIVARPELVVGLDSPDDGAVVRGGDGPDAELTVHTVDFFRYFMGACTDPYVFGRVAAVHALSDCHAMGAAPRTCLAIATLPLGLEAKVEEALYQMMAGACALLREEGCALAGGHTCEGKEASLGFAVTGVLPPNVLLRKGGMRAGDALLLTKPLGTGTILAAEMRNRARGPWVAGALASMSVSNGAAAKVLAAADASACTDVTGFGLLGHLFEPAARRTCARCGAHAARAPALSKMPENMPAHRARLSSRCGSSRRRAAAAGRGRVRVDGRLLEPPARERAAQARDRERARVRRGRAHSYPLPSTRRPRRPARGRPAAAAAGVVAEPAPRHAHVRDRRVLGPGPRQPGHRGARVRRCPLSACAAGAFQLQAGAACERATWTHRGTRDSMPRRVLGAASSAVLTEQRRPPADIWLSFRMPWISSASKVLRLPRRPSFGGELSRRCAPAWNDARDVRLTPPSGLIDGLGPSGLAGLRLSADVMLARPSPRTRREARDPRRGRRSREEVEPLLMSVSQIAL